MRGWKYTSARMAPNCPPTDTLWTADKEKSFPRGKGVKGWKWLSPQLVTQQ